MSTSKKPSRTVRWGEGYVTPTTRADGSERFQARWPERGADGRIRFRAQTFDTEDDALDHLRKKARERRDGRDQPTSTLTVEQVLTAFLKRGEQRWTANTVATFRCSVRRYIVPYIGTTRAVSLTPRQIQHWIDDLVTAGRSASIISSAKSILSNAMRDAMQLGIRDTDPTIGVRVPKRRRTAQTSWTIHEVTKVLRTVSEDPRSYAFYLCAILTGMRPGELRALQWGDIDMESGVIQCRRTMTRDENFRQIVGTETKTHRDRAIAIPDELVEALQRWRRHQRLIQVRHAAWQDLDVVFDAGDGSYMYSSHLERRHRVVVDLASVRYIRPHDLRHTSATLELEANTHPKIVQERLGHSSISTTLDRYSHISIDLQKRAADEMADRILNVQTRGNSRGK